MTMFPRERTNRDYAEGIEEGMRRGRALVEPYAEECRRGLALINTYIKWRTSPDLLSGMHHVHFQQMRVMQEVVAGLLAKPQTRHEIGTKNAGCPDCGIVLADPSRWHECSGQRIPAVGILQPDEALTLRGGWTVPMEPMDMLLTIAERRIVPFGTIVYIFEAMRELAAQTIPSQGHPQTQKTKEQ